MAPILSRFWAGKSLKGSTKVVVKMENANISTDTEEFELLDSSRKLKNSKKTIMVLRISRAIGESRTSLAAILWFILILVAIVYFKDLFLHLSISFLLRSQEFLNFHGVYTAWLKFRADYIAPVFMSVIRLCVVMFVIQSLDRFILCLGCVYIKFKRIRPTFNANHDDPELGMENYHPMVLVQIPMCNEKEVYVLSISAACQLDWPRDRLLIQILDDSNDELIREMIESEVFKWSSRGTNIVYQHRLFRTGYKAGNLNYGMSFDYVKNYEFVALFDADFQPTPEFLNQTVPHFKDDPDLGLVQCRWSFANDSENLLTRLQNINLSFHFEVEQQVQGAFLNFFGFNGTAGVWRIRALEDSGGWLDRTTVEDMDIAVRAHLNGWKFIFLNHVKVPCELPESYEAYRKQQHRWHSGPLQLFRLCLPEILQSKISAWKKANLIFLFFVLRKLILPFYSFTLFCIVLPLTMFVPESEIPIWAICFLPILVSFLNILPAPRSLPFMVPYLLFENIMSVTKFAATVSGLFRLRDSYEWIVTTKSGRRRRNSEEECYESGMSEKRRKANKKRRRIHGKELGLALFLLMASVKSLVSADGLHFYFLVFQGITFLVVSLDLIGETSN